MLRTDLTIVENVRIARDIYRMVLHGITAEKIKAPGQFVHIRCGDGWETLLRRPISIASWEIQKGIIAIIYRAQGKGTNWLAARDHGERIDVLGPLGNGFPISEKEGQNVLLIGGGVGVPPLYGLAQELQKYGAVIHTCLGFASRCDVFLAEAFGELGTVEVATDDGSFGHGGLVTDLIREPFTWDIIYACGPLPMLRAVQQRFNGTGIEGYLSLEARMGCGVGACLACVCELRGVGRQVKVCSDGPVFPYQEVAL